jgi:anti-anti-sigma factor
MLIVRTQKFGDVSVVRLQGRIVIGETQVLRRAVSFLPNTTVVLLDFALVRGIDAHGLGVLLDLRRNLLKKGIQVRLRNVSRSVRNVFEMTCLDGVFEIVCEGKIKTPVGPSKDSGEFALMTAK